MPVFKGALVSAALASVLLTTPALAADLPPRTAGLWTLEAKDNPFADWSMCINETTNDFINTDAWANFKNECKVTSSSIDGSTGEIKATCKLSATTDAELQLTFSGDFKKSYSFESVTQFVNALGKKDTLRDGAEVTYVGKCPAELKPGMKKMTKSGQIFRF